jgi:glycosyltransferase involved in cell wall biosynthesis
MKLSVIIPTFNRLRTMKTILKALENQTLPLEEFEVITIDDGSTDGTLELLKDYRGPLNLRVDSTGLPVEEYGCPKALNQGIRLARGTYLLFMDSDMVPRHNALEKLMKAHEKWESQGEKVAIRAWWVRRRPLIRMWLRGNLFGQYSTQRTMKRNKKFQKLYKKRGNLRPQDAPIALFSVKKDLAIAVNGFPEHIRCYGIDYEFQERLVELAKVRIVFEPEIYAIHGPMQGDIHAEAYRWTKRLKETYKNMERKGLSDN